MKSIYTIILAVCCSFPALACSCFPWNENFFDNIRPASEVVLMRLDSTWTIIDTNSNQPLPIGKFTLLKNYSLSSGGPVTIGDTMIFYGQDGVNCAVGFLEFKVDDTLMASIVFEDVPRHMFLISFHSPTGCGVHHLIIKNGRNGGSTMTELEAYLNRRLTGVEDYSSVQGVKIWPNPVRQVLTIYAENYQPYTITVRDMTGRTMIQTRSVGRSTDVDVSILPAQTYVITFERGQVRHTEKFVRLP